MRPERERAETLHGPWPSSIEELQAEYIERWNIWREQKPDGSHSEWVAQRIQDEAVELRAINSEMLQESLAEHERRYLRGALIAPGSESDSGKPASSGGPAEETLSKHGPEQGPSRAISPHVPGAEGKNGDNNKHVMPCADPGPSNGGPTASSRYRAPDLIVRGDRAGGDLVGWDNGVV
ncbi:hypothetical protein ACFOY2_38340 [Nonomuraea purpurea]|uniref:Uncharacterized protein n=1 Tax=Nonomuraea purpurea TaxID=1849276 RepID=A0ABV8GLS5_9ACTN